MTSPPKNEPTLVERIELLTVKDAFQLNRVGLILLPDFRVPNNWKNVEELVLVVKPDGTEIEVHARLKVVQFNVPNSGRERQRERAWRVVVVLLGIERIGVPQGSRVLVSTSTRSSLLGPYEGTESFGYGQ